MSANNTTIGREKFDMDHLRPVMRRVLNASLTNAKYQDLDSDATAAIAHKIKQHMLEQSGQGFKYIVFVNASKNNNQGLRADASMHWEMDADAFVQDVYQSEHIICICVAYAIRI
ncbi:hypothetical protein J056_000261 [Wallemia ichthyophaga EXF-994]|uniref:Uncharacterized protein n=1 Tax=Wallemia ichthyophaga (strain EXF-994 / CBS 113033) TaxID=1299270 RepID=R9AXS7_WALI9|nr:uncharacterized protein J056_000261 [Wallemia ichthyophaga EXF-994]EOR04906.1 hypothetical protein J056_000261 [Wallemia ichthyophaga EXF-994]